MKLLRRKIRHQALQQEHRLQWQVLYLPLLPHLPAQTICEKRKIEMQKNHPFLRVDSVFTIIS